MKNSSSSHLRDIGIVVGDTVDRVKTPIAFGVLLSILAAIIVIAGIWKNIESEYFWLAIIIFALTQLFLACLFVWIGRPKEKVFSVKNFTHVVLQPVSAFIDDSPIPTYLCELTGKNELTVRYCNKALLELLMLNSQQVINKDIEILINELRKYIPCSEQSKFDERQKSRIKNGIMGRTPDSFLSTIIDTTTNLNPMGRKYKVRIRTFSLYTNEKKTIGACSIWMLLPTDTVTT